jgi:hypothetical protein
VCEAIIAYAGTSVVDGELPPWLPHQAFMIGNQPLYFWLQFTWTKKVQPYI